MAYRLLLVGALTASARKITRYFLFEGSRMVVVACFEGVRSKRWAAEGGGVRIDAQSLRQGESGEKFLAGKAEGDRQGRPR